MTNLDRTIKQQLLELNYLSVVAKQEPKQFLYDDKTNEVGILLPPQLHFPQVN